MKLPDIYITLILFPISSIASAQAINDNLSYRNLNSDKYFRINYENDFFTATDEYYTQGIYIELVNPALRKFPLSKTLIHPKANNIIYGMGIEHNAYTPSDLGSDKPLYGDRPFAASLFLKTFLIAMDTERKDRFSSSLSTGVIGPSAFGHEMQAGIHKALGDVTPHGWQNQIKNDAVINYEVDYEKSLLSYKNYFNLNGFATARAGTLSDKAGIGITVIAGTFNSPFKIANNKKLRIYLYDHPEIDAIGYDAPMEGGVFTQSENVYVISPRDVSTITFQNRFGAVLTYKRLYVEYYYTFITKEFNTGKPHQTGGITVGF
ncbi:MAG TPA: lipid A deacylase LpxR family protein [Flavipsychrobacter sp.]|nr:lipid A deacylase LpxR family protein [Flavipsychrobacter sp.]